MENKNIINESFDIKTAEMTAKDGHKYKVAYINAIKPDETYSIRNEIKKYGARYLDMLKTWGWYLGSDPQSVINKYVKPCLEYLRTVEKERKAETPQDVIDEINKLISDLNGGIGAAQIPNSKNILDELTAFKADLLRSMGSEEFKAKMAPIIKFRQAQGHQYSFKNAIMILIQDPDATLVKSKTSWAKMNRIVKDTSHPIIMWRPDNKQLSDTDKNLIKQDFLDRMHVKKESELNPGQKEELRVQMNGGETQSFKTYFAYDVRFTEQMEGKEDLVGNGNIDFDWYDKSTTESQYIANLIKAATEMIQKSGVKILYVPLASMGGALGVSMSGTIKLASNPKPVKNYLNTIVHEFSHEMLHQTYLKNSGKDEWAKFFVGKENGRGVVEQQAEISAWIVLKHFGFDMPTSLNYAGSWGMDDKTCAHIFDTVAQCSSAIISNMTKEMKEMASPINNNVESEVE